MTVSGTSTTTYLCGERSSAEDKKFYDVDTRSSKPLNNVCSNEFLSTMVSWLKFKVLLLAEPRHSELWTCLRQSTH